MQLMETTAVELANQDGEEIVVTEALYNPDTNIKLGTKYYAKRTNYHASYSFNFRE